MISSIELKSNDIDDGNYSPVFQRSKKEFVLKLSEKATQEVNSVNYLLIKDQFNSYSKQKRFCIKILWWKE
jgi:hypothetical protein